MKSIKTNPNSAKGPDRGKIVNKLYCILLTTLELPCTWYKSNHGRTKTLTDSTQKGGFIKLCVKIKKRCYTDLLHFSTRKHNLVSLFGRIVF
jgi:hypothetical protein